MKVRLLPQKAIESNVKPQPVKPQHKEVKQGHLYIFRWYNRTMKRQTGPPTQGCFQQNAWCCKAYKLVSFAELGVSAAIES